MGDVGKKRVTAGLWAMVGGPSTMARKVFVPADVVLAEGVDHTTYMLPIVSYMDGSPVPQGMLAVIHRGVHTPDVCVGIARLMGAHLVEAEDD